MTGAFLVFLGACSYGVLPIFVVLAYAAGFTLNDVVGSQMLIGVAMLWLFQLLFNRTAMRNARPATMFVALFAGLSAGTTGLLYYAALQYVSPAFAVVLFFQFTWMGLVLDCLVHRRLPRLCQILAIILIWSGTVLASNILHEALTVDLRGVGFGLLAALSNTILIFVSGRVALDLNPVLRSCLLVSGGAILTTLIVPPAFLFDTPHLFSITASYGLPLAFFGSFFSMLMFAKGAPQIDTGLAAILSAMQLPVTMLLSVLVLEHSFTLAQLAGIVVILAGVAMADLQTGSPRWRPRETINGN